MSLREGDRYFLCDLLHHVTSPRSFNDMRTGDWTKSVADRETSAKLGILSDDSKWKNALRESLGTSFVLLKSVYATISAQ